MRGWLRGVGAAAVAGLVAVSCSVSGDVEVTGSEPIDVTAPTPPPTATPSTDETTEPTRPRPRPTILSLPPPPTPGPGGPDVTFGAAELDDLSEEIAEQNGITQEQARCFIDGMLEIYTIDEIIELGDLDFSALPDEEQEVLLGIYGDCVGITPPTSPGSTTPGDTTPPGAAIGGGLVGDVALLPAGPQGQVALVQSTALDQDPLVFFFRNDSAEAVSANTLAGTVTGPDGTGLGEIRVDYSVPDTVGPGGAGMFVQFTSEIGGPFPADATVDVAITSEPAGASSFLLPMEISAMTVAGGTVTNTSGQDIESVFVEAACLDDAGTVLDYAIELPNTEVMATGTSLPFTLAFADPGCTKVVAAAEGSAA